MRISHGKTIEELQQAAIDRINKIAGSKIETVFPLWKQSNVNAKAVEILSKESKTQEDKKILSDISAIHTWIKEIQDISNIATDAILTLTTPQDIRNTKDTAIATITGKVKPNVTNLFK